MRRRCRTAAAAFTLLHIQVVLQIIYRYAKLQNYQPNIDRFVSILCLLWKCVTYFAPFTKVLAGVYSRRDFRPPHDS